MYISKIEFDFSPVKAFEKYLIIVSRVFKTTTRQPAMAILID